MEPNIATPIATLATIARVVVRLRNSRSGTIGSVARSSVTMNAAIARTPPPTNRAVSVEAHAKLPPARVTQISSRETPAVRKAAPR